MQISEICFAAQDAKVATVDAELWDGWLQFLQKLENWDYVRPKSCSRFSSARAGVQNLSLHTLWLARFQITAPARLQLPRRHRPLLICQSWMRWLETSKWPKVAQSRPRCLGSQVQVYLTSLLKHLILLIHNVSLFAAQFSSTSGSSAPAEFVWDELSWTVFAWNIICVSVREWENNCSQGGFFLLPHWSKFNVAVSLHF